MRFSLAEAMCDPSHYVPLAQAAERAGFDGFIVPDSIAYPRESDSKYPYTPDGSRSFLEDKPFLDPFCLSAALGAVTERLRFITSVVKLPIRSAVLIAKQLQSVAVLTNGRFVLGVGTSPWPDDYRICEVPWEGRGQRLEEALTVIRGLERGDYFGFEGEHFRFEPIKMCPVPARRVPILIGGHAEAALARAARLGDGWIHAGSDEGALPALVARVLELRARSDRAAEPFEIHVISRDAYRLEGLARLRDIGVTDVIAGFRVAYEPDTMPLSEKLAAVARYGERVIARARAAGL
jgi:probable F420-dependent oxidoreductase